MAAPKLKMRLGDLLVHEHIITNEQLMQALNSQKTTGRKLGDTLIELAIYLSVNCWSFWLSNLMYHF